MAIAFMSWLCNVISYRIANECNVRREAELAPNGTTMRFDSFETDLHQPVDLLVVVTFSNELNVATFPVRQQGPLPRGPRDKGLQERLGDFGGEERFVNRKSLDSAEQMTLCIGLEKVATCAGLKKLLDEGFVVMHRED